MNISKVLNIFFPQKCPACGKIGTVLCEDCEKIIKKYQINLLKEEIINIEKNEKIKVKMLYIFKYEGIIRKLLIDYKFNDKSYLYETFKKIILKNKKICRFLKNYDIIIPVPLHKKRKQERGYNQSELIAKSLGNIELDNISLVKIKDIKPQSKKSLKDRIKDVQGVYSLINIDKLKNKKVLLIDDIYTTGSTVNECIKVLSKGAKEIGVLIIAKDYMEVIDGRFS